MTRTSNPKISKHVYETEEEARAAFDSFKDVLDENGEVVEKCYHKPMGLKTETETIDEEEISTGRWQLDIRWFFEENEEGEYEVPKEFKDSKIDLEHEGNHGLSGYSYLKNKI